jgi:hypothetical protein
MMTATAATAASTTTVMGLVVTVTTPHALVLTVSHDWPVADSQFAIPSIPCKLLLHPQPAARDRLMTVKSRAALYVRTGPLSHGPSVGRS